MSFFSCIYQLLIGPLEIFYEFIYKGFSYLFQSHGLCIIFLSLVMNFLLLPLYRQADAIQDAERQQEKDMADIVAHIKKTFQGDERFMMLQAYYRQNHYKPYYVLKGFLPLMLEIPFFIAAYHFLSNYQPLSGTAFGPIRDLGAPDQLLHIFGVTVNLLPVLMTLINIISGTIYTKGFPLKDKLQLYGMALLFLVLLYDSPAGLVVYWTLNNLFSLVKNLLGKMKKGRGVLKAVLAAAGAALLAWGILWAGEDEQLPAVVIGALLMVPALLTLLMKGLRKAAAKLRRGKPRSARSLPPPNKKLFVCSGVFLAVLTGMLIPSAVIVSSPGEFINNYSPLRHILNASLLSFGLFVVWCGIFHYMFSDRGKRIFCGVLWVLSGMAVVNYMFFGTNLGLLSAELYYDKTPVFQIPQILLNLAVLAALAALMILVYRKRDKIALWAVTLMMIAVAGMSCLNMVNIQTAYARIGDNGRDSDAPRIHVSLNRDGKNVVFIMLDAAISRYLPYIFEEMPDVAARYAGFVYYPNTVSFAKNTNMATAALYGGYEYTPEELNRRSDESLETKQNEALLVLPRIFAAEGYRVTVCDPPYAGYSWVPDLSVFDGYDGITALHTEQGQFASASAEVLDQVWQRNFFCYSLMKASPLILQPSVYDGGYYLGSLNIHTQFEKSYAVLKSLREMTEITGEDGNTFLSICNSTTHEPVMLSLPDYTDVAEGDPLADGGKSLRRSAEGLPDIELDSEHVRKYYMVDTAALIRIGEWLDYLRENGVYDNTRIIIAADHGRNLGLYSDLIVSQDGTDFDIMSYNPLLLVKDFGSTEFTTDEAQFMTLADVPRLLTEGLVTDPVNPFTGKEIEKADKEGMEVKVFMSDLWSIDRNNGNTFQPGDWFSVRDNIFDPANWKKLGEW